MIKIKVETKVKLLNQKVKISMRSKYQTNNI